MSRKVKTLPCFILWLLGLLAAAPSAGPQGSAASMQMVRDQLRAEKKLLVSNAMTLTEAESKRFWPVYECYQKEFGAVSDRLAKLIANSYASMTNESGRKLVDDYLSIEADRQKVRLAYLPQFRHALSEIKVSSLLPTRDQDPGHRQLRAGGRNSLIY